MYFVNISNLSFKSIISQFEIKYSSNKWWYKITKNLPEVFYYLNSGKVFLNFIDMEI